MNFDLKDDGARATGQCPNCNVHASFSRADDRQIWPQLEPTIIPHPTQDGWDAREFVYQCLHCNQCTTFVQVYSYKEQRQGGEKVGGPRRIWPPDEQRELQDAAPMDVRSLYTEASRCEAAQSYRAAGAMYRAAVERLCDNRGAIGRNLKDRINDLANQGVPQEIVTDLHEARLLGNWSLHDGLEFSADEVADVAELLTEAVHILYVQPAERARMRQARKHRRDQHRAGTNPGDVTPGD